MTEAVWLVLFGAVLLAEAVHQRRLERERRHRSDLAWQIEQMVRAMRPMVNAIAQFGQSMEQAARVLSTLAEKLKASADG